MNLSRKNIDKLNSFIKNKKLISINNNSANDITHHKAQKECQKSINKSDPNEIFYSIIDNSDSMQDTCQPNQDLKKSEENFHSSHTHNFNKLSSEDELYDEFNYLLDD